jgi:hypothetical protein
VKSKTIVFISDHSPTEKLLWNSFLEEGSFGFFKFWTLVRIDQNYPHCGGRAVRPISTKLFYHFIEDQRVEEVKSDLSNREPIA